MTAQVDGDGPRPLISVVIPALNEARNLPYVLGRLPEGIHEVILVDGHSSDGTVKVARELRPDLRIVIQTRKGKGNALACGFGAATGDIIAMIDADGSTDPAEIPGFVQVLLDGADFAKGTRFGKGAGSADITRLRSAGNYLLTRLVNFLYGTRYSDLCYGYNVFWRSIVPFLGIDPLARADNAPSWGDGFEIETLINIRVADACLAVTEVASFEHARIHGVSNLNAVRDGRRVLRTILHEYARNRRKHASRAADPMPLEAKSR